MLATTSRTLKNPFHELSERGGVISGTKDFRDAAVRAAKHGSRCGTGVGGAVRETEVNPDDAEVEHGRRATRYGCKLQLGQFTDYALLSMPETVVRWSLSRCDQRHNLCEREAVDFANEKGLNVSVLQDWLLFPILQAVILFGGIYCWWEDRGRRRSRKEGGTQFRVGRSDLSMNRLGAAAGFAVLVVTLINQTAFGVADFPYGNYSVFFNVLDTAVILYVCFYNGWARNLILDRFRSAKEE